MDEIEKPGQPRVRAFAVLARKESSNSNTNLNDIVPWSPLFFFPSISFLAVAAAAAALIVRISAAAAAHLSFPFLPPVCESNMTKGDSFGEKRVCECACGKRKRVREEKKISALVCVCAWREESQRFCPKLKQWLIRLSPLSLSLSRERERDTRTLAAL